MRACAVRRTGQERARGTRERIDGLVLVADDTDVASLAEPQLEQPLLERVRVLVFVDAEPALARADRRSGVVVALEQVDGVQKEVVEVDPAGAALRALVAAEQPREQIDRDRRLARRRRRAAGDSTLVGRRRQAPALGPLDLVGEVLAGVNR